MFDSVEGRWRPLQFRCERAGQRTVSNAAKETLKKQQLCMYKQNHTKNVPKRQIVVTHTLFRLCII